MDCETMEQSETSAVVNNLVELLTGSETSAIAVFRLRGREVAEHAARRLSLKSGRTLHSLPLGKIFFGFWKHPLDGVDQQERDGQEDVVVCRIQDQEWELHTHGSPAVRRSLWQDFRKQGIRVAPAEWVELEAPVPMRLEDQDAINADSFAVVPPTLDNGLLSPTECIEFLEPNWCLGLDGQIKAPAEWWRETVDCLQPLAAMTQELPGRWGRLGLSTISGGISAAEHLAVWLQSQAYRTLGESQSPAVGFWLWQQLRGALLVELRCIGHECFPNTINLRNRLTQVLKTWSYGRYLSQPIQVLLTGAPNVGKSSLSNAILGYERSVVSAIPGTTRDLVGQVCSLYGWTFRLVDSAGLRQTDDSLEKAGIERVQAAYAHADVILTLRSTDQTHIESEWSASEWPIKRNAIRLNVLNKIDLESSVIARGDRSESNAHAQSDYRISTLTGQGLGELIHALAVACVPSKLLMGLSDVSPAAAAKREPGDGAAGGITTNQRHTDECPRYMVFSEIIYRWLQELEERTK